MARDRHRALSHRACLWLPGAFSPTVRVSCPARTSGAPDWELRWLVAFDIVTIRHTPLPALESVSEVEETAGAAAADHDAVPEHRSRARADHHVGRRPRRVARAPGSPANLPR